MAGGAKCLAAENEARSAASGWQLGLSITLCLWVLVMFCGEGRYYEGRELQPELSCHSCHSMVPCNGQAVEHCTFLAFEACVSLPQPTRGVRRSGAWLVCVLFV